MTLDYLNKNSNLKALNAFIFGGSGSIGVMEAGYHLDGVLELTDDMYLESAYHFNQNFNSIPIIPPSTWENSLYLRELKNKNYDLIFANCPCSSLSMINRNRSVDGKHNIHFYRLFDTFKEVKPKAFVIENAPTLITMGYPILKDMVEKLSDEYKFTIIRDYAGSHGVAMKRMRTLVIGWRRDVFNNKIPLLHMGKQDQMTVKDLIGDLYNAPLGSLPNHTLHTKRTWSDFEFMFNEVKPQSSIMLSVMDNWETMKDSVTDSSIIKQIETAIERKKNGKNIWDKSPWRPGENNTAPSITSITELIHPTLGRPWTVREYARLMGYPDDFVLYPDATNTDIIQTLAQGVPANLVKYITSEVKEALNENRSLIGNQEDVLNFQHHTHKLYKSFTFEELMKLTELESDKKTFNKLEM